MENEILERLDEPCDECGGVTEHKIMNIEKNELLKIKGGWYIFTECTECHDEYRVEMSDEEVIENFTRHRNQLNRKIATLKKSILKQ